jgi:hypothetical protein
VTLTYSLSVVIIILATLHGVLSREKKCCLFYLPLAGKRLKRRLKYGTNGWIAHGAPVCPVRTVPKADHLLLILLPPTIVFPFDPKSQDRKDWMAMTSRLLLLWLLAACLSASVKVVAEEEVEEEDDEDNLCVDEHENCMSWAEVGECEKNPGFMEENCERSCNICSGDDNNFSKPQVPHVNYQKGGDLGVPQQLSFPDGTREEDIQWQIGKARNYMRFVVSQQFEFDMHQLCQTKHERCGWWALLGECTENPECKLFLLEISLDFGHSAI